MSPAVDIQHLSKVYHGGHKALTDVSLDIKGGEILALLGPNGAGKTTLISIICGLVEPTSGSVQVNGFDIKEEYRSARASVGLVPQELYLENFATVSDILRYTRGYFGKRQDNKIYKDILTRLSLWDKRDSQIMSLSGGMKRRVLLARALISEPKILFLDEPTAGVDVELRRELMSLVKELNGKGMTIILTTHYLEEAEQLADRVAFINNGKLEFVKSTSDLIIEYDGNKLEDIYVKLVNN